MAKVLGFYTVRAWKHNFKKLIQPINLNHKLNEKYLGAIVNFYDWIDETVVVTCVQNNICCHTYMHDVNNQHACVWCVFLDVSWLSRVERENLAHMLATMHIVIRQQDGHEKGPGQYSHLTNLTYEKFVEK